MEQQGTVNKRTIVLFNFRSVILAPTIFIYIYILTGENLCNWVDIVQSLLDKFTHCLI